MSYQIEIADLSYRPEDFPRENPDILRGISLQIEAGSFVALVGSNGSGKTTLIKQVNGLLLPSKGTVFIQGLDTKDPQNSKELRSLVGMVFQDPAHQIVASTVEEDVAFGLENLNLPSRMIQSIVKEQLLSAGLSDEATRPPHLLSGGQIQKVALAGVLARRPSIILFDEPTSMLDPLSRQKFMATILDLKNRGLTILLVTHHMEEAVKADRVIVMSKGQIVLDGSPGKIFIENNNLYEIGLKPPDVQTFVKEFRQYGWQIPRDLLKASELFQFLPQFTSNYPVASTFILPEQTESIISFDDVQYTYLAGSPLAKKALNGVHLSLNSERIHGIAGGNGSGKSTLLQNINGILRPQKGRIQVGKFRLDNQSTLLNEVIRYVGLVFQNPETQFFEVFTGDEIAYGPKQFGFTKIRERVRRSMALVNLDFEAFKDRRLETLSGGEKRKVAIASTLVLNQPVLLFDEPTAGMDPASKEEMLQLFTQLREDGKTMLIASHRMNELATVTNSITIMRNGKVEASGRTQEILQNTNTLKRAGLVAPLAVQLSSELSKRGWPLQGKNTASADGLFQAIREVML